MLQAVPCFWRALDDIPGHATDMRDWRQRLGDEFGLVKRYLRRTGEIVEAIDCPSPGGDGCPRHVVHLPAGRLRAVCGCSPSLCDTVELTGDDIAVLCVDYAVLAQDLAGALGIRAPAPSMMRNAVIRIGQWGEVAGATAPALIALSANIDERIAFDDLVRGGMVSTPSIIITAQPTSVDADLVERLREIGHLQVHLSEVAALDDAGQLMLLHPAAELFATVLSQLQMGHAKSRAPTSIPVPVGTSWAQITLVLRSSANMDCTVAGIHRTIGPAEFDMLDRRRGSPANALMTPLIFDSCITMPKQARLSWTPLFVSGWVT